ncbi:hypothetical protein AX17_007425, partial [Amanita inopinata Kibby_2008]
MFDLTNATDTRINGGVFNEVSGDNNRIINNFVDSGHAFKAIKKVAAVEASYDSAERDPSARCLLGTREAELLTIEQWAREPGSSMFWLYGGCGAGKTSIAQTLAENFAAEGYPLLTFFARRGHDKEANPRSVCATFAIQLASRSKAANNSIRAILNDDLEILTKNVRDQFEKLVLEPIQVMMAEKAAGTSDKVMTAISADIASSTGDKTPQERMAVEKTADAGNTSAANAEALKHKMSTLIVIDALDEFEDTKVAQELLDALRIFVHWFKKPLRIFFTSHLSTARDSDDDIRTYLKDGFARIKQKSDVMSSDEYWPDRADIEAVVVKSSQHFIDAATVIRFVDDDDAYPPEQLNIIQGVGDPDPSQSPFASLDALYLQILRRVPDRNVQFLRDLLGLMVLNSGPISIER